MKQMRRRRAGVLVAILSLLGAMLGGLPASADDRTAPECSTAFDYWDRGEWIPVSITGVTAEVEEIKVWLQLHDYDTGSVTYASSITEPFAYNTITPVAGQTEYTIRIRAFDDLEPGPAFDGQYGYRVFCDFSGNGESWSDSVPVRITANMHRILFGPEVEVPNFRAGETAVPITTSRVYNHAALSYYYDAGYTTMKFQVRDVDTQALVLTDQTIPHNDGLSYHRPSDTYTLSSLSSLEPGHYLFETWLTDDGSHVSTTETTEFVVWNPPLHHLSVQGAYGSGDYAAGTEIPVHAWSYDSRDFTGWEVLSGDAQVVDPTSPDTTIIMGSTDSEVIATSADICVGDHNCNFYLVDDWTSTEANRVFHFGDNPDQVFTGDFDGWGDSTVGIRKGNYFLISNYNFTSTPEWDFHFGRSSDTILVGDWDGDGKDTLAIRRGNRVYLTNTLGQTTADDPFYYGREGDEVLVGDWDGDGKDTLGVRRGNTFYLRNSNDNGVADITFDYGRKDDQVLVGDWNGNGIDTFTVRRGRTYYMANTFAGGLADQTLTYGRTNDLVIVGDWDANGEDTLGIYRPN